MHRSAAGPAILWSSLFCGTKATKGASEIFREIHVVVTDFSICLRPGFCLVSGMSCLSPDDQMPLCRFVIICWNIHRGEREGCVVCAGLFFPSSTWFILIQLQISLSLEDPWSPWCRGGAIRVFQVRGGGHYQMLSDWFAELWTKWISMDFCCLWSTASAIEDCARLKWNMNQSLRISQLSWIKPINHYLAKVHERGGAGRPKKSQNSLKTWRLITCTNWTSFSWEYEWCCTCLN